MAQTEVSTEKQEDGSSDKMEADVKATAAGGKMKPSYKHIPHSQKPPHLVAKRNARERRRVQAVNQAFYKLRKSVPIENRNKRVSKVKTLQRAIDYIRRLEMILAEDGPQPRAHEGASSSVDSTLSISGSNLSSCHQGHSAGADNRQIGGGAKQRLSAKKSHPMTEQTGEFESSKRAAASDVVANQKLKRGRKPNGNNKEQPAGELHQPNNNNNNSLDQAHTRDSLVQCTSSTSGRTRDEAGINDGVHSSGLTVMGAMPLSGASVSYGRPRGTTTSLPLSGQHYSNHHYHYYMDGGGGGDYHNHNHHHHHNHQTSDQQHHNHSANYAAHPPLPVGQQLPPGAVELSSTTTASSPSTALLSSTATTAGMSSFSNYSLQAPTEYQYGTTGECSPVTENRNQQHRAINQASQSTTTLLEVSASGQDGYLLRQPATSTWQSSAFMGQQSTGASLEELECDKRAPKVTLANGNRHLANHQSKQRQIGASPQSMPADSTSAALNLPRCYPTHGRHLSQPQKLPASINSPPISICSSSSSLSPSTTLKSLDLSGGGCGGGGGSANTSGTSTTSSTITSSATSSNRSDKSPTTTTTSAGSPVVCRPPLQQQQQQQQHGGGNNNSNHDAAHSTTARRDFQSVRGQQVNNYADQPLGYGSSRIAYDGPFTNGDYHGDDRRQKLDEQQQQPQQRPFGKSIGLAQTKPDSNNGQEFRYRDGSRSSQMQQPLVGVGGGNYLANNLHGNGRHGAQLFQQPPAPTTYYQHLHHNQQQLHHHHHHQHQHNQYNEPPSSYQPALGQHFSANQHGPHHAQHHSANSHHLSGHHNQCHVPVESSSSSSSSAVAASELVAGPNANTIELITATNIMGHHHNPQPLSADGLGLVNGPTASITAPTTAHYTILPL